MFRINYKNIILYTILLLLFNVRICYLLSQTTNVENIQCTTEVRKGPYLIYTGNNTEYLVLWQLVNTRKSILEWGTDSTYSLGSIITTEYDTSHQHKYKFTNLIPGTKYYYRVIVDSNEYANTFNSAPKDDVDSLKFIAYGDTRSYPADHNKVAEKVVETFMTEPEYQSIVLSCGDLVKEGNIEAQWDEQFFDSKYKYIQKVLGSVGFQVAIANHERDGILFNKYFPYPYHEKFYWSFDYGPVHFIMVDQYISSFNKDSEQLKWLENELKTTEKKWKIIALHKVGWSTGHHGSSKKTQELIQPLCEKYGVKLIIGGHNHEYVRAVVNGVTHITTGGGGAPLDKKKESNQKNPHIIVAKVKHHFCKINIIKDSLDCTVIDDMGNTIDKFTIVNRK